MFGKRARQDAERMRDLRAEKAMLLDRLNQLRATRIRYSIKVNLGLSPVWDSDIESAILAMRFTGGQGAEMPAGTLEVVSQYTPLLGADDTEDEDNANDIRPGY
jgi:hypothetical protein